MIFSRLAFSFLMIALICSCTGNEAGKSGTATLRVDSLSMLRKGVNTYPDSLKLRLDLSKWLQRNKKIDAALQPIEEGLVRDSTAAVLHNIRALLLLEKGDTTAAIKSLIRSLTLRPEQTDVHLELGFIYAAQKNKNALSVGDFLLNQSDDPSIETQSRYLKGVYYTNMGMTKEALSIYDEIIVNDYTFIDAYLEKGILMYADKKYAEALKSFDKAMSISSTNAEAYLWAGKCFEALGKKAEALDFYKKAVGLNAGLTEAEDRKNKLEISD